MGPGARGKTPGESREVGMAGISEARAAKREVADLVRGNPHVNGIGLARGAGGYAVKVNLDAEDRELRRSLPGSIGGAPVVVEVVGPVRVRAS